MQWSVASVFITIVAVTIGLHWGVQGVAMGMTCNYVISFFLFTFVACKNAPVAFHEVLGAIRIPFVTATSSLLAALFVRAIFLSELPQVAQGISAIFVFAIIEIMLLFLPRASRRECLESWSLVQKIFAKPAPGST